MKRKILIGLVGVMLLLGASIASLAAAGGKESVKTESETETETEEETETESESESETETETETESRILYAPGLTLSGTVIGGYAGTITLLSEDGEEYVISFVNAKTDFSDSGLYEGMAVKCVLKDLESDEDGIFTAEEITTVKSWE